MKCLNDLTIFAAQRLTFKIRPSEKRHDDDDMSGKHSYFTVG